jgi:hypothetical protein
VAVAVVKIAMGSQVVPPVAVRIIQTAVGQIKDHLAGELDTVTAEETDLTSEIKAPVAVADQALLAETAQLLSAETAAMAKTIGHLGLVWLVSESVVMWAQVAVAELLLLQAWAQVAQVAVVMVDHILIETLQLTQQRRLVPVAVAVDFFPIQQAMALAAS